MGAHGEARPTQTVPGILSRKLILSLVALLSAVVVACGPPIKETTTLPPAEVLPLQTATLEELLERLRVQAEAVRTVNAVTTLEPSTGSAYSGVIEQYHDVRAFVLAERQPAPGNGPAARQVRVIGQAPVVRKNIFDMVADDSSFRVLIHSKNKFIVGPTTLRQRSDKPIENLRPQHLFDALFFELPRPDAPHLLEENEFGGLRYYAVSELGRTAAGGFTLERKWWFERTRLALVRVQHFEGAGRLVADIHYGNWRAPQGDDGATAPYPRQIELRRPLEDYRVKLVVKELALNEPLRPEQFQLEKPAGAELVELKDEPGKGPSR